MKFDILFPEGKTKACTFSYDDGQIFDRRLAALFDAYQLKATFHLNSGSIGRDSYVGWDELKEIYKNHEVSCHGYSHPYFTQLSKGSIVEEILEDKKCLEAAVKYPVRGMSYPYGIYSDKLIESAKVLGMEYSRTVEDTNSFGLPVDFMKWHPTCHHNKASDALVEQFLNPPGYMRLPLFYIWGHSFEFDRENSWSKIEGLCEKLAHHKDTWYATNIEIKDYISAFRGLVCSAEQNILYNPSGIPVYLKANEKIIIVHGAETVHLN